MPGVQGVEEAVAKGSGRGQNSIYTTGGTGATCMCRQWVSRTQADGPAGQLSREKKRKFKRNRMSAMSAMPLQGAQVSSGRNQGIGWRGSPCLPVGSLWWGSRPQRGSGGG